MEKIRFAATAMMVLVLVGGVFAASVSANDANRQAGIGEKEKEIISKVTAQVY